MSQTVVDELETIKIEIEHRCAGAGGVHVRQDFLKPFLELHAVRQSGQSIVVRHVGDSRFGLPALRHIDDRDQNRRPIGKCPGAGHRSKRRFRCGRA